MGTAFGRVVEFTCDHGKEHCKNKFYDYCLIKNEDVKLDENHISDLVFVNCWEAVGYFKRMATEVGWIFLEDNAYCSIHYPDSWKELKENAYGIREKTRDDVLRLLIANGWTVQCDESHKGMIHLTRPGRDKSSGSSASLHLKVFQVFTNCDLKIKSGEYTFDQVFKILDRN